MGNQRKKKKFEIRQHHQSHIHIQQITSKWYVKNDRNRIRLCDRDGVNEQANSWNSVN